MSGEQLSGVLFVVGLCTFYGAFLILCISVGYFGDEMRKLHKQAGLLSLAAAALFLTANFIPQH